MPKRPLRSTGNMSAVSFDDVRAAAARIDGIVAHTPVISSPALDTLAGRRLFFKCENLQHVGAFKYRGASNAVALLGDEAENGICTHSSGNHAQAVALAAKRRGVSAYIVMPDTAPKIKVEGVRSHGAEITFCEPTLEARETTAASVMQRTGATFVHPFDNPRVVAGQGTAALELIAEVGPIDAIIAPIGGGGLLSGTSITTRALLPNARIFGAEPSGADDAARSLAAGELIPQTSPDTICDGLLTSLCEMTYEILSTHLEAIITVTDQEVIEAMRLIRDHLDMIVEPSSATVLAAILRPEFVALEGIDSVGLILSGGNVDSLPF
ncbi:MAG: pyridoxal-phosphate dependent enzyme [Candidatus Thermoplasmatota archaeon]|nr:pyridoxal-phosphate dependent enzyme [Candidatus Thermoplasmatota archaeon]